MIASSANRPQSGNVLLRNVLGQSLRVLPASVRQLSIATDATAQVEDRLAMPRQVDGPRNDVDVHEVVHDARLDVT